MNDEMDPYAPSPDDSLEVLFVKIVRRSIRDHPEGWKCWPTAEQQRKIFTDNPLPRETLHLPFEFKYKYDNTTENK